MLNEEFKEKSIFNEMAAKLLITQGNPGPTVHCVYYSCIQLMLYIIFDKKKIYTELQFKEHTRGNGTHKTAIETIRKEIKYSGTVFKSFQREIVIIKKLREKSDYHRAIITPSEGYEAIRSGTALKSSLKLEFKI
jgi:hypothetical protein